MFDKFQSYLQASGAPAGMSGLLPFFGAMFAIMLLVLVVFYVYNSLAWYTIAKKLKHEHPWLAWIPIANGALILQLGEFHWAWIFLILIPILGWLALGIMAIIAIWRIFEKRNYQGWLALVPLLGMIPFLGWIASIAFLIILGFVAWKDN